MDLLKFRYKDNQTGKFVYSYEFDVGNAFEQLSAFFKKADGYASRIDQFTGLQDRHGRDIYEGDILNLESWNPPEMQVSFIEGAFCLADKITGEFMGDIHYIHHANRPQATIIGQM